MKNIIILGAFINNKGAQSMIFTVVDEIKKRYPNANISVLVNDKVDSNLNNIYNFNFLYVNVKEKLMSAGGIFSLLSFFHGGTLVKNHSKEIRHVFKNTDLFIDISGFALSSKFSRNNTINYLTHISIAKKFNKPIVLFPQSFGPFNYNKLEKPFLMFLIKKYLKYPSKIYTREKEGYEYLKSFGLNNVTVAIDTVLQKDDAYTLSNIYRNTPILKSINIKESSVAIIPNVKTLNKDNQENIYHFYSEVIKELISLKKNIYLIRHSTEDLDVIKKIYQEFQNIENVYLITEEYDAIELHQILKEFDYIVASRYHSIVHAYKVKTPALVLGWAVKYQELLQNFNQNEYQFDIKNIDLDTFISKLRKMNDNFMVESNIINDRLKTLNEKSIFDEALSHFKK